MSEKWQHWPQIRFFLDKKLNRFVLLIDTNVPKTQLTIPPFEPTPIQIRSIFYLNIIGAAQENSSCISLKQAK